MTTDEIIIKAKEDYGVVLEVFNMYDSALDLFVFEQENLNLVKGEYNTRELSRKLLEEDNVFQIGEHWIYASKWYDVEQNSYAARNNIKPFAHLYRFTQEEIDQLVNDFVEAKTGLKLDMRVGCLADEFDVYVEWALDDLEEMEANITEEQEKAIQSLGLSTEEDFMNRDYLFQEIFDVTVIGYRFEDGFYELTVYRGK